MAADVEDLKEGVQQIEGIAVDQQRIVFCGKQLENGRQLAEYGIEDGSVVHLVLRLRGGDSPSCPSKIFSYLVIHLMEKIIT